MLTLRNIFLAIACVLFFIAAAGLETWGVGTIKIHNGWAGLFFLALSFFPK